MSHAWKPFAYSLTLALLVGCISSNLVWYVNPFESLPDHLYSYQAADGNTIFFAGINKQAQSIDLAKVNLAGEIVDQITFEDINHSLFQGNHVDFAATSTDGLFVLSHGNAELLFINPHSQVGWSGFDKSFLTVGENYKIIDDAILLDDKLFFVGAVTGNLTPSGLLTRATMDNDVTSVHIEHFSPRQIRHYESQLLVHGLNHETDSFETRLFDGDLNELAQDSLPNDLVYVINSRDIVFDQIGGYYEFYTHRPTTETHLDPIYQLAIRYYTWDGVLQWDKRLPQLSSDPYYQAQINNNNELELSVSAHEDKLSGATTGDGESFSFLASRRFFIHHYKFNSLGEELFRLNQAGMLVKGVVPTSGVDSLWFVPTRTAESGQQWLVNSHFLPDGAVISSTTYCDKNASSCEARLNLNQ